MDFAKLCAERYSLRKFDTRPVEQEKLDLILEAGRNAPTAHNKQPQRILCCRAQRRWKRRTPAWAVISIPR